MNNYLMIIPGNKKALHFLLNLGNCFLFYMKNKNGTGS